MPWIPALPPGTHVKGTGECSLLSPGQSPGPRHPELQTRTLESCWLSACVWPAGRLRAVHAAGHGRWGGGATGCCLPAPDSTGNGQCQRCATMTWNSALPVPAGSWEYHTQVMQGGEAPTQQWGGESRWVSSSPFLLQGRRPGVTMVHATPLKTSYMAE